MAKQTFIVNIELEGTNEVINFKSDTLDITVNNASDNNKRLVFYNGYYWYSNGTEWVQIIDTQGQISYNGELTPPTLSISQNDYSPTGLQSCNFLRISSSANINITGLLAPSPVTNQAIYVCNVGSNNITFKNNDAGSSANNRFLLGGDRVLQSDEGLQLIYDKTSSRWRSQSVNI